MAIREESAVAPASRPLPLFVARPGDHEPHPAVIIFYEIFGLTGNIMSAARRVAEAGYVGLVPDFFRAPATPYDDFARARETASGLSDDGAMEELKCVLDWADEQPFILRGKTAVLGFCMGGRLAFLSACRLPDRVLGCIDFYGARKSGGSVHPGQTATPLAEIGALSCPILLLYGGSDPFIPPEEIQRVRDALTDAGKQFELRVYPQAQHGFACEERSSYDPDAATDAWARSLNYLHNTIGAEIAT